MGLWDLYFQCVPILLNAVTRRHLKKAQITSLEAMLSMGYYPANCVTSVIRYFQNFDLTNPTNGSLMRQAKILAQLSLFTFSITAALPAAANNINISGAWGSFQFSGSGAAGQSVTAVNNPGPDASNWTSASGGWGGTAFNFFGNGGSGGAGGDATADTGTTASGFFPSSSSFAYGGYGGSSYNSGNGGAGGKATAFANTTNPTEFLGAAYSSSYATGGKGGVGVYNGGNGGEANATANARAGGNLGIAYANANASAGLGGTGATSGNVGAANALATADGNYSGSANAKAKGGSGSAQSISSAHGGTISSLTTTSFAPVSHSTVVAESKANINGPINTAESATANVNANAYAYATGHASGLATSPFGPNVAAVFNNPNMASFDRAALGANYAADYTGPQTYSSSVEWIFNRTGLPVSGIINLGLINSVASGGGFTQLIFNVQENGTTLLSQSFSSIAAANAYFTDRVIGLGALPVGNIDLKVNLAVTSNSTGSGYGINFATGISAVPEPEQWAMMLTGFGLVGWRLRQARRVQ